MALITDIENEFKKYCTGITLGVNIDSITPSLMYIERNYIKKELGKEQYDTLVAAYEASIAPSQTAMSAEMNSLWDAVASALCPLAAWHFAGANAAELSDAGQRERDGDQGTGARLWVSNLQRNTWYENGLQEIDNLLAFLDENKADYPDWVAGTGYAGLKANLLQTTEQFNELVNINSSRALFKKLRPSIKQVEFLNVRRAIGADLYARLITGIKDGDLTNEESEVLNTYLIPAIAHLAMAECKLPVEYGADGIYTVSSNAADNGTANKATATNQIFEAIQREHKATGHNYLTKAVDYLNNTATDSILSEYYSSGLYEDPSDSGYGSLLKDNDGRTSVFNL